MEGRRRAAEMRFDEMIAQAWHAVNLGNHRKMPELADYLRQLHPKQRASGDEILAAMREFQSRGAKMRIRKVKGRDAWQAS